MGVRLANSADLIGMAASHIESFPGLYATAMGERYLAAFYQSYLSKGGIAFVAEQDGLVVGHVVGGEPSIRSRFMSGSLRKFWPLMIRRFATSQPVRRAVWQQFAARLKPPPLARRSTPSPDAEAWLQVICVVESVRGTSVAKDLLLRFLQECSNADYKRVGFKVSKENPRAIAFYEKHGFRIAADADSNYVMRSSL